MPRGFDVPHHHAPLVRGRGMEDMCHMPGTAQRGIRADQDASGALWVAPLLRHATKCDRRWSLHSARWTHMLRALASCTATATKVEKRVTVLPSTNIRNPSRE